MDDVIVWVEEIHERDNTQSCSCDSENVHIHDIISGEKATHVKESIWRELVLQMGIGGDGLSFWAGVEV
eukprot:scaffold74968_cov57-Cyclotella_meneghiniana.AAC.4